MQAMSKPVKLSKSWTEPSVTAVKEKEHDNEDMKEHGEGRPNDSDHAESPTRDVSI